MKSLASPPSFSKLWILIAFPILAGCGGSDESVVDRPKTTPVQGVVTLNGDPLEGATVTLVPKTLPGEAFTGKGAFGKSDAEGKFTLMSFEPGDGAVPGEYDIMVQKYEVTSSEATPDEANYVPPEEGESTPAPKSLIPEKYTQTKTSGLTVTIPDAESFPLPVELK